MPETVFLSLQYANVILLQGEGQHGEDCDQIPGENGMIYITGDTHGDFARFSAKRLRRAGMELTQESAKAYLDLLHPQTGELSVSGMAAMRSSSGWTGWRPGPLPRCSSAETMKTMI